MTERSNRSEPRFKAQRLIATFEAARDMVSALFPLDRHGFEIARYGFYLGCPLVQQMNRQASRNLMHIEHRPGLICVARAALDQDRQHLLGLWLHEFGHAIGGPEQRHADEAIGIHFGIPIQYDEHMIEFVEL